MEVEERAVVVERLAGPEEPGDAAMVAADICSVFQNVSFHCCTLIAISQSRKFLGTVYIIII